MKIPLSLLKTLLLINVVIATLSGLFILTFRILQAKTASQISIAVQAESQTETYRREMKVEISDQQKQLQHYRSKIQQLEKRLEQKDDLLPLPNLVFSSPFPSPSPSLSPSPVSIPLAYPSAVPSFSVSLSSPSAIPSVSSVPSPSRVSAPSPTPAPASRDWEQMISFANDLVYGLSIAHQKGQIPRGTQQYRDVQTAIKVLRRGNSLPEAAQQANIALPVLEQLIEWGQTRPNGSNQPLSPLLSQSSAIQDSEIHSIHIANDVAYGLTVAHTKGQITYGTWRYREVQTAIKLLRKGYSLPESAQRAKVPLSVLEQLVKWGEQRPGRGIDIPYEITRRNQNWWQE